MEDSYIIQLFLSRSEQAVTELDKKYGRLCHSISFNILKNLEDVKECLNDTYLGVWNSIPPNRPNPLKPYVCRIARNTALKKYRYEHADKRFGEYGNVKKPERKLHVNWEKKFTGIWQILIIRGIRNSW